MRRLHLVLAALLVIPVFFSCNKPEPEPTPVNPTPTPTPTPGPVDPTPTPQPEPQIEFRRTIRFDNNIISTNGSNDFVAVFNSALVTKAGDPREIKTGTYTFDNSAKTFTYNGFGKLEIISDTQIAFTPDGGSRKVYDATMTEIVKDESSVANRVNRSWIIKESILRMDSRGVYKDYSGLDLNKVESDARDLGVDFKFHMEPDMVVTKVIITDSILGASFKNGKSYAAEHNLGASGGKFNLSEFTNGLTGTATVQFIDELCTISIDTNLDDSPSKIILTLAENK